MTIAEQAAPEITRRAEIKAARRAALRARREAQRAGLPVPPLRGRKRAIEDLSP